MTQKQPPKLKQHIPDRVRLAIEAIRTYGPQATIAIPAEGTGMLDPLKGISVAWVERSAARVLAGWIDGNRHNIRVVDDRTRTRAGEVKRQGPNAFCCDYGPGVTQDLARFVLGEDE